MTSKPSTSKGGDAMMVGMGDPNSAESYKQPLISKLPPGPSDDEEPEAFGCFYRFRRYFNMVISRERRTLHLNSRTEPGHFLTNKINN
mmetsp:Transcript_19701/g.14449  ORF Transcript_19701/g.14449 Transcript_19701/m.14449 type:complete len:88 (+) Transcript_19701:1-264(+)